MGPRALLRIVLPAGMVAAVAMSGCKGMQEDLLRFEQAIGTESVQRAKPKEPDAPKKKQKCAAMPLEAAGISPEIGAVMDEIVLAELQRTGFEAIGKDDIKALLGFEQQKSLLGCDEASCIAEVGNALGVQFLVAGKLAAVDDSMILTLKLIDVRKAKVLARVNRMVTGGKAQLPAMISASVQELVKTAEL